VPKVNNHPKGEISPYPVTLVVVIGNYVTALENDWVTFSARQYKPLCTLKTNISAPFLEKSFSHFEMDSLFWFAVSLPS
jgi:hypothetical protein